MTTDKELAELALMHRRYLVGAPAKGDCPVMVEELLYDIANRLLELEAENERLHRLGIDQYAKRSVAERNRLRAEKEQAEIEKVQAIGNYGLEHQRAERLEKEITHVRALCARKQHIAENPEYPYSTKELRQYLGEACDFLHMVANRDYRKALEDSQ